MARRKYSGSTVKKTRKCLFNGSVSKLKFTFLLIIFSMIFFSGTEIQAAFVDSTVAIVGDDILAYRDIEKRFVLKKLSEGSSISLFEQLGEKELAQAIDHSIRAVLVRSYLKRVALDSAPDEKLTELRLDYVKNFLKSEKYSKLKSYYEMDEDKIKKYIGENLAVDGFFSKLAVISMRVSDEEVREYYESEKDNKFYGRSFDNLKEYIRKYLQNRKTESKIQDWVKVQKKHVKVQTVR